MVDGVGVCTICAKVCHKDHDITYAKYGSFFCDCGAKEDGSCIVSTFILCPYILSERLTNMQLSTTQRNFGIHESGCPFLIELSCSALKVKIYTKVKDRAFSS